MLELGCLVMFLRDLHLSPHVGVRQACGAPVQPNSFGRKLGL